MASNTSLNYGAFPNHPQTGNEEKDAFIRRLYADSWTYYVERSGEHTERLPAHDDVDDDVHMSDA